MFQLWNLWRNLLHKERIDADLDAEVRAYVDEAAAEKIAAGASPTEARRRALIEFGGVEQVKEEVRGIRAGALLEQFWQDGRYGVRVLAKSPGFTLIAILTLAFGIGLNTTLFSVFNAVALKPLPVRDAANVVRLERWFVSNRRGNVQYAFSNMEYVYLRDHGHAFDSMIAASFPLHLTAQLPTDPASHNLGSPENVTGQLVSANYFSDLGVRPTLGRGFYSQENTAAGANPVAVLSYPFWHTRLNDDPQIVGKVVKINDTAYTVVGVTPSEFVGTANPPAVPDIWAPLAMQPQLLPGNDWLKSPLDYEVQVLAHLRPSVTMKQAEAETAVLIQQFAKNYPNAEQPTTTVTLQVATFFGNTEDPRFKAIVVLLMTIVGMVLLIACANLANMLLAKAAGRQREIAVRCALGARRSRVLRQLLTESTMLGVMGGMLGLVFSIWGTRLLWVGVGQFAGTHSAFITEIGPDARVFMYTALLSVVTGILFGLSPALQSSRPNLSADLKDAGSAFGKRLDRSRLRGLLVAAQVAVSTLFLITAGLLARGVIRSQGIDPGLETRRVYPLGMLGVHDPAKNIDMRKREMDLLRSLPEVRNIAVVERVPLYSTWTTEVEPKNAAPDAPKGTLANHVSPEYFDVFGIGIVRGRNFTRDEAQTGAPVAIVSEAAARKSWPGQDPIGKRLRINAISQASTSRFHWVELEVVGVAADVRSANLSRVDPSFVYMPTDSAKLGDYWLTGRIEGDPGSAFAAIARTLTTLDGQPRPGFRLQNLEDGAVKAEVLMSRTFMMSATILAAMALVLAAIGVYGVMAFLVSQREKEIGIRMALGAGTADVLRLMIEQGMRPVIFGGVVGLLGALAVSGSLRALLFFPGSVDIFYGGRWFDPVTFGGLALLLAAIALAACYIPARRATYVDPMVALRHE